MSFIQDIKEDAPLRAAASIAAGKVTFNLVLQNGAGPEFKMRGFKGRVPDTDLWNIVNYLRSVGPIK